MYPCHLPKQICDEAAGQLTLLASILLAFVIPYRCRIEVSKALGFCVLYFHGNFSALNFNKIPFIVLIFNAPRPRAMKWLLLFLQTASYM